MEFNSILGFLENKSILLTGATGFLAKVVIEKILRVQPNVTKLYLLLRATDSSSALHRFNTEVMEKDLFRVVKEKYGAKFNSLIKEKVTVLSGDITCDCLGLESSILEELFGQVNIVINLAATIDFDERYDIAMEINTIGASNVLSFSKKCRNLRVLLHVSTAYVCGEKEGDIRETPLKVTEAFNGRNGVLELIDVENKIIEDKLKQLQAHKASHHHITSVMKDLGFQRAKKYGWPNTYTFTKAMGEMLLGQLKNKIPLVIIRPTIITSTFKEPFPGWIEGVRSIDYFIVGYGKGKMTCFPGHPQTIIDLIPADMVVNAMMVSMAAYVDEATHMICHVGSSSSNPVPYHRLRDNAFCFFTVRPWIDRDGQPLLVTRGTQLPTSDHVRRYVQLRYLIPLKIIGALDAASCRYFFHQSYLNLSRKVKFLLRLVELFSPYVFFNRVFDDTNTEKLRNAAKDKCGNENGIFYFDPKIINWDDYFMHTHMAGVVKYSFTTKY